MPITVIEDTVKFNDYVVPEVERFLADTIRVYLKTDYTLSNTEIRNLLIAEGRYSHASERQWQAVGVTISVARRALGLRRKCE